MTMFAVLGATGNCGRALIENLQQDSTIQINAYCRNKRKLVHIFPHFQDDKRMSIFEGSIDDVGLLSSCIRGCAAVFLVVSTNDNIPGCRLAQNTAIGVIHALEQLRNEDIEQDNKFVAPRLVLLSSASLDATLCKNTPAFIHWILMRSASHVYSDLQEAEKLLRAQQGWVRTVFVKPGGLSVDQAGGHVLSLVEEKSPVSYLDLAAGMIEAATDPDGRWDMQSVAVSYASQPARAPRGALTCMAAGLLRHYLPFLHPYLPTTGPY